MDMSFTLSTLISLISIASTLVGLGTFFGKLKKDTEHMDEKLKNLRAEFEDKMGACRDIFNRDIDFLKKDTLSLEKRNDRIDIKLDGIEKSIESLNVSMASIATQLENMSNILKERR